MKSLTGAAHPSVPNSVHSGQKFYISYATPSLPPLVKYAAYSCVHIGGKILCHRIMAILSRMKNSRLWVTVVQLLATDLLVLLVELMVSSTDTNAPCEKPSWTWNYMPFFRRSLTTFMNVSYQECLLQHRRKHLYTALAADAFVLFLRLRGLFTFLWMYFVSFIKQTNGGWQVSEKDRSVKISIYLVPQPPVAVTPPRPAPAPRTRAMGRRRVSA